MRRWRSPGPRDHRGGVDGTYSAVSAYSRTEHHHGKDEDVDHVTAQATLQASLQQLRRVHERQLQWRIWVRVAWWLLLLPVALACWATVQKGGPRQVVAWGLAALALSVWIGGVTGSGTTSNPATRTVAVPGPAVLATSDSPAPGAPTAVPATVQPVPTPAAAAATVVTVAPVPPTPPALVATTTSVASEVSAAAAAAAVPAGNTFATCKELNAVYPHGIGRPGAVDHVSGHSKPVTTFLVSAALYAINASHDADGDGIACERA